MAENFLLHQQIISRLSNRSVAIQLLVLWMAVITLKMYSLRLYDFILEAPTYICVISHTNPQMSLWNWLQDLNLNQNIPCNNAWWIQVKFFTHILQGYFTGTGAVVWLTQCRWTTSDWCRWYRPVSNCSKNYKVITAFTIHHAHGQKFHFLHQLKVTVSSNCLLTGRIYFTEGRINKFQRYMLNKRRWQSNHSMNQCID